MSRKKRKHSKRKLKKTQKFSVVILSATLMFFCTAVFGAYHYVRAYSTAEDLSSEIEVDPNTDIKPLVETFLREQNAEEMIPIIKCESHFRHYEADGSVLKNMEGSSAIGVAQILSSKHPDPKIIYRYNKRNDTAYTVDDFDITTLNGNIGYALILYKIRGTQDWECSKKFKFE